jgi:3-phosphoshikimate 1-carboxyvinyltransferase
MPTESSRAAAGAFGLRPGGAVVGRVRLPASKSIAQRAIVCAGLAQGTTEIAQLSEGAGSDVRAALALVAAAGAKVETPSEDRVRITGLPPGLESGWAASARVSAGESGTLARFATAAFALCGKRAHRQEIRAEGTLRLRKSPALFAALERAGAELEWLGTPGAWPLRVRAAAPVSSLALENPGSSQEASALWIALAARAGARTLEIRGDVPSRPYLELTRRVLARFGAEVGDALVRGPLTAPAKPLAVEPDGSSAAVALAAGCLSGGRAEVAGLDPDSAQPDAAIGAHLEAFGCRVYRGEGTIAAEGPPTRGAEIDLAGAPDLAPVLAAVAASIAVGTGERSRLAGLATLPGKESPRIEVLAHGLSAVGLDARAGPDSLDIRPGRVLPPGSRVRLDPWADHRMAFAFALLGLAVDGVDVAGPECVGKSWPGFWEEMERLGAAVSREGSPG